MIVAHSSSPVSYDALMFLRPLYFQAPLFDRLPNPRTLLPIDIIEDDDSAFHHARTEPINPSAVEQSPQVQVTHGSRRLPTTRRRTPPPHTGATESAIVPRQGGIAPALPG